MSQFSEICSSIDQTHRFPNLNDLDHKFKMIGSMNYRTHKIIENRSNFCMEAFQNQSKNKINQAVDVIVNTLGLDKKEEDSEPNYKTYGNIENNKTHEEKLLLRKLLNSIQD